MEKQKLKSYLLLISYTIGLLLVVVHFRDILHGIGLFAKLLTPLFIGIMLAFVLNRPCKLFGAWYINKCHLSPKLSRGLAICTVYLLGFGAVTMIVWTVLPELVQNLKTFADQADQYIIGAQTVLNQFTVGFGMQQIDLTALIDTVNQYLGTFSSALEELLSELVRVTTKLISGIVTAFISIALSIYIMNSKEQLQTQVRRVVGAYLPRRFHSGLKELSHIVSQVFGDYVAGQCKEAIILGVLCFAGMMILRLDYAGIISIVIAIGALVPIVGAYVGGAVAVLLLMFVSPAKAVIFLIFLIILQQIEGNVIYPRVVGRKIGLPGMWVLLSISVWGGLFGIWGMLLGVPATTILYQLLGRAVRKRESMQAAT